MFKKYGGFFMEYCARKLNFGGATLIRLLKCKDYRMSLNFIMTLMDALIVHQIKIFCDTIDRSSCSQNVKLAIERLKSQNWNVEIKQERAAGEKCS